MGRYYDGDIEGKFWFGLQSSSAADRFGSTGNEPGYLEYYFDTDNLEDIQKELKEIESKVNIEKITKFFDSQETFTELNLEEAEITAKEVGEYADWRLGKQIEECVIDNGECNFTAEC